MSETKSTTQKALSASQTIVVSDKKEFAKSLKDMPIRLVYRLLTPGNKYKYHDLSRKGDDRWTIAGAGMRPGTAHPGWTNDEMCFILQHLLFPYPVTCTLVRT
jgi:hypothetical protein